MQKLTIVVAMMCFISGCIRAPEDLDVAPAIAERKAGAPGPVAKKAAIVYSDAPTLIKKVSEDHNVPAGAIYGVWSKESNRLASGWGDSRHWMLASDLAKKGSPCAEIYGLKKCKYRYKALASICAQKRPDGSKLCDPEEVRTSYAMALGPMQHMPDSLLVETRDGRFRWNSHAVDYDKDGVYDPFSLPDAMAMSAKFLRAKRDKGQSWTRSINGYYGSQTAGYYEGVAEHWLEWCKEQKGCSQPERRTLYALND